jgi:hypothetical protein
MPTTTTCYIEVYNLACKTVIQRIPYDNADPARANRLLAAVRQTLNINQQAARAEKTNLILSDNREAIALSENANDETNVLDTHVM